ncbi:MAG: sporulation protein YabP [Lachnospiraceae bacterium]|nr:sporulation protein YabP [Lachnospiraceae bacterium]MEE1341835.1 sporulation protein YabP [Lachnospiraceae bacterium]
MEERQVLKPHKINMNNRKEASISGVKDVLSFDAKEILLETELGMLMIKGDNLHVTKLTLDKGEVEVDGTIDSLQYSNMSGKQQEGESFLSRLFK